MTGYSSLIPVGIFMQVTETKSEGLSREFQVSLPAKDIEEKISTRLKEIAQTASIPGFRPGKVPVSMLRKRYGPSIMGEILERAVGDSSQQAISEKGIRPASQPEIEITSFDEGKDLEYTIKVEMIPEIKPVDYSKLKLERLNPKADEEQVNQALDNIASAHKTSAPIKKKRKSKNGDILVIDFVGSVDGEEFPGGKADDYELELGSNSFIPGFEDQLVGTNAGDDTEVNVKFPDEYGAAELAGKDALFKVAVKEIREGQPADIDDELAKKLGLESLDKLKETIAEEQGREFKQLARMRLKRTLLDQLADACDFDTPQKMAETEFNSIWEQYLEQKKQEAEGESEGDSSKDDDLSEEEQRAEFQEIAERRVRLGLLLSEVGQQNNIQILQDDITKAITEEARKYPGQEQAVMEHFQNNPDAMQQLSAPLYEEKVVDFILEMATVKDKDVTSDELMKALEADNADAEETSKKPKKSKPKAKAKAADKGDDKKAAPKKKAPAKKAAKKD
jgi:trigger factor